MENSAGAPLIPQREDGEDEYHESLDALASTDQGHDGGIGIFMWLLALSAGISGLLFGYDTGVISATLVSLGTSLSERELTSFDKSIITSSTALFALIASPLSSVLADAFGRKRVILLADILFIIGAVVQGWSGTVSTMVIGRAVVGAAVGAASFVTPMYIAELAPAAYRGRLVTTNVLAVTLGQVIAYVIGWAFAEHGDPRIGWRWMVGLGALPAVLQCSLIFFMPETPRWLVKAGKSSAARQVIQKTLAPNSSALGLVDGVLKDIQLEVREEEQSRLITGNGAKGDSWLVGWHELIAIPKHRRALTIACLLQGLQQLCGFNSLMYFSATIFTLLGFSIPTLTSLSVAATNFMFTMIALLLVDRIGRRRILLYSIPFMIIGLILAGFGFRSIHLPSTSGIPSSAGIGPRQSAQSTATTVVLTSMIVYVASYAIGLGNVPWMQSELFPLSVRSLGSGAATATNWLANFVVGLTFLPMMDALTPTWTFVLYAIVCVLGWVAVWMVYPETSGLSLEEVAGLLDKGWGVK
ncbi:general substrate transporter [Xylariales sp. AK1849]|nr:general substrate transporter [Xylariales sp. AK1849]